jgi:molybdenum cofactor cytidylyltransferase
MAVTCVVLAAGRSSRFGSNKLLHRWSDGDTLLARALRACGDFPVVAVCSSAVADALAPGRITIVTNDRPDRGMAHSLRLANARIDANRSMAVLPADLALIERDHVARVVDALGSADIVYPVRSDGTPGHPVVFSARARSFIDELPDGDTIRLLRDRPELERTTLAIEEAWPYADIDAPSAQGAS